jgi:MFS family permease
MSENSRPGGQQNGAQLAAGRLTLLFAIAYVSHGIAAQFGLIAQPLQYFMMKGLHFSAGQVSSYLAIMMLPWVLKPFYGLVCDFIPLFGYRRKSYLCIANALTASAFFVMASTDSLAIILGALLLSAVGMAASTAITVGLAVEGGRGNGKARDFFAEQTFFYYSALIVASIVGGLLCNYLTPKDALHLAAMVAAVPVLLVSVLAIVLVKEDKSRFNSQEMRKTWASIREVLRSRSFWLVALFIWCWDFSPSFGVPLYFHESNVLGFSQSLIGQLAAWNAGGMVVGAVVYRALIKRHYARRQLWLAVALGSVSTIAYLLLSTPASAIALEVFRGTANMIAILAIYALAADICPPRMEVSLMATLIAVRNLATEGSTFIGGQLYGALFHNQLAPLVIVAAVATALCALLIPFLPNSHGIDKQSK